jgi:hypothetical protein
MAAKHDAGAANRAHAAVQYAVRKGVLASLADVACAQCGAPAANYHHTNGYAVAHRLAVVALCRGCHRGAHRHTPQSKVQVTLRFHPPARYERMAKLAAKEGIPINTWATRAIEREAERLERQEHRAHGGSDGD